METKITSIREGIRFDKEKGWVNTRIVTYLVGDQGPFTLTLDEDEFDTMKVQEKIEEEARKIEELMR